jgi:hypothetical protein
MKRFNELRKNKPFMWMSCVFLYLILSFQTINTINQAYFDSVTVANGITVTSGQVNLAAGTAGAPAIGWIDTGFYENGADNIGVSLNGGASWNFSSTIFRAGSSSRAAIMNEAASSTNPVFCPGGNADNDSGLTTFAADSPGIAAGGVAAQSWAENAGVITHVRSGLTTRFTSETVADDAEIVIATGVSGWGFAQIGDNQEWGQFSFTADGTVTLVANSANTVNTDTDAKFCIYDAGSGIAIKNRLGSSLTVRFEIHYSS